MKKILTISALALSALNFVSANNDVKGSESGRQMMMTMPMAFVTGDPAIDSQVKALQKEMQDKMKAIAEEYSVKIRKIVGDKKPITATGTNGIMKDTMHDMRGAMKNMMASGTKPGMRIGNMDHEEREGLEKDENRQDGRLEKVQNFFRGFFTKENKQN